jgi:hypothetical protein
MGTHSVNRQIPLLHRLRAWWEEYYADNPVVWLLHRQIAYANRISLSNQLQELEKQLKKAEAAKDWEQVQALLVARGEYLRGLGRQPFWKPSDRWVALILWAIVLFFAMMSYQQAWQPVFTALRMPNLWVLFLVPLPFIPLFYPFNLRILMVQEQRRGTNVFLWLTRLDGRHLVYGALTALVGRFQLRPYLVYFAPFVWLAGMLAWDSWLRGLWVALMMGYLWITFGIFWQVVSVFTLPASSNNFVNQLIFWIYIFITVSLSMIQFSLTMVIVFSLGGSLPFTFGQVGSTPIWLWLGLSQWWLSLLPPMGLVSLLKVGHLLWGVPQGLVYLGLAWLLLPVAVGFAERARLRPEPTVEPEEGNW